MAAYLFAPLKFLVAELADKGGRITTEQAALGRIGHSYTMIRADQGHPQVDIVHQGSVELFAGRERLFGAVTSVDLQARIIGKEKKHETGQKENLEIILKPIEIGGDAGVLQNIGP